MRLPYRTAASGTISNTNLKVAEFDTLINAEFSKEYTFRADKRPLEIRKILKGEHSEEFSTLFLPPIKTEIEK